MEALPFFGDRREQKFDSGYADCRIHGMLDICYSKEAGSRRGRQRKEEFMAWGNQGYLEMMRDIFRVSEELGIRSYVWGGFAVDILQGSFTREHGDLDCFTENLAENRERLQQRYEALGYEVHYMEEFWLLRIEKGGLHASFNNMRNIDGIAHWYHAGPHGTVFFPYGWLDEGPRVFYGTPVRTIGERLAYVLKTNARLLHPEWKLREKDRGDIAILEGMLGEEAGEIGKRVWSHSPFWSAKGYEEYYYPVVGCEAYGG